MFKAVFVTSMYDSIYILKNITEGLKNNDFETEFKFYKAYEIDKDEALLEEFEKSIFDSDIIFMFIHGGICSFKNFYKIMDKYRGRKKFFIYTSIEDEVRELQEKSGLSNSLFEEMSIYYKVGGEKNLESLIKLAGNKLAGKEYKINAPFFPKCEGIYFNGKVVEDTNIFLNTIKSKDIVGVLFHARYLERKNLEIVDYFEKILLSKGIQPLIVFTNSVKDLSIEAKGTDLAIEELMKLEGKFLPKCIINLMPYSQSIFSSPGEGKKIKKNSIFEKYQVPVIQAMCTYQDRKSWDRDNSGLDIMSLVSSVYYPEFDGQLISVTCGTYEKVSEDRYIFKPIEERVERIVNLSKNWLNLTNKKNCDKKIAIIYHNMPPRNDMIGCAFSLDTPKSVYNMICKFEEVGIKLDYKFRDGEEIIKKIIEGVTIEKRWLTPEKVKERSIDTVSKNKYKNWFNELTSEVKKRMINNWGEPLGEHMVYNDAFPIPGILNGNIFIGLQPPRGYDEKVEEIYHSTDIVIPHQYYSFYKWIKEVFKADIIYHIGTHGTLEWLPGKEVGLSNNCFPDINIADIPHLYPYSINVTGEGLQAKRRSNAILISHMIPSLMLAGAYDSIEEIDNLLKEFYQSISNRDSKKEVIIEKIIDITLKNNYHIDLKLTKDWIEENKDIFIEKLHTYIENLKCSTIKDGLHILGEELAPKEKANLIYSLMRIDIKNMLSADKLVAQSINLDIDFLKDNPEGFTEDIKNLFLIEKIKKMGIEIIYDFIVNNFSLVKIRKKYTEIINFNYIEDLITNVEKIILPKLKKVTNELESVIKGLEGKFISPGKSGCPTRGGMDILPTGTNFYSIDPNTIPSRSAWEIGKVLAKDALKRYLSEEKKYPNSITMVIYGGEAMKTNGEDIAEAMYLMGVEPIWLENSDKVIGIRVIPLDELNRPRIDVVLRITGLFRDTFPNIINLMENSVNLIAQLNENPEDNYLKKNIESEIIELIEKGVTKEKAKYFSKMRVFGCPPGTYGAGVDFLLNSQEWETREDLGRAYIKWSGYAYGEDYHGEEVEDIFSKRLSKTDITIKNEASVEIDMLESDDYFTYHGGLTAAVKQAKGENPKSYIGDSSDPSRINTRDLKEESSRIMRARVLNPKWIEGLKKHGYKGAQEMSVVMDIVFGWDATSEIIEDWMYNEITKTYVENNELREWIEKNNPHALLNITEKLLEAESRDMWKAPEHHLKELRKIYLRIEGDIEEYEGE